MDEGPLKNDMEALRSDLAKLRDDVARLSGTLAELTGSRAEGLSDAMQENLRMARDQIRDQLAQAGEHGRKAIDEVEDNIGRHPFTSVAAALGVGYLLAKLMDSRH